MKKRQVHIYTDSESLDKFQRFYPSCLTRFLCKCIKRAIVDKSFFNAIFFDDEVC